MGGGGVGWEEGPRGRGHMCAYGKYALGNTAAMNTMTLGDPMDCGPPGSSVHGIFQARVLEWVAISFSRGSSWSRDQTWVSRTVGRCFTMWATREVLPMQLEQWKVNLRTMYWKMSLKMEWGPPNQSVEENCSSRKVHIGLICTLVCISVC